MKTLTAFILCFSFILKDGILANWSWDHSIAHAQVEHSHAASTKDKAHNHAHSGTHQPGECPQGSNLFCLSTHAVLTHTLCAVSDKGHPAYKFFKISWIISPDLRPPIS